MTTLQSLASDFSNLRR